MGEIFSLAAHPKGLDIFFRQEMLTGTVNFVSKNQFH
jgi:hypothetical protein